MQYQKIQMNKATNTDFTFEIQFRLMCKYYMLTDNLRSYKILLFKGHFDVPSRN